MNSIWRAQPLLRATNLPIRPVSRTVTQLPPWRFYSDSSSGGGSQSGSKPSGSTRQKEHPGPPPPDVGQTNNQQATQSPSSQSTASNPEAATEATRHQPYSSTAASAPNDDGEPDVHHISKYPSNKAHPTLTTGQQSPNVDEQGRRRSDIPEEVKEHNEAVGNRHDRSYNQITDEGNVQKGF